MESLEDEPEPLAGVEADVQALDRVRAPRLQGLAFESDDADRPATPERQPRFEHLSGRAAPGGGLPGCRSFKGECLHAGTSAW
jgi:hypothetical protein